MGPPPASSLLTVRDVTLRFGGIVALDGVSFELAAGQIVGLIGPNGAGKTTLFNCLSRLYAPERGEILFDGRSLLRLTPSGIAGLGIGRTFQNLALFPTLTVLENVLVGLHSRTRSDFASNALRLPWAGREERRSRAAVRELLPISGGDPLRRALAPPPDALRDRRARHRPDVSESRAVSDPDGARERPGRAAQPDPQRLREQRTPPPVGRSRGTPEPRGRAGAPRVPRPRGPRRPSGGRAPLRHPQACGAGPGAGRPAAAPAPRRARGRPEQRGGRRPRPAPPRHP